MRSFRSTAPLTLRSAFIALSVALVAMSSGCGGGGTEPRRPQATALTLSPDTLRLTEEQQGAFTAAVTDETGAPMSSSTVMWASDAPTIAKASAGGHVEALLAGVTTVRATLSGLNASGVVVVAPAPVATLAISPTSARIVVGRTLQLNAQASSASGRVLSGRTITWSSSDSTVAQVTSAGLVSAISLGQATITTTSEGKSAPVSVEVIPVPVGSVTIEGAGSVTIGRQVLLIAQAKDSAGQALTGRAITWGVSDTTLATVSASGVVTGRAAGAITITATTGGVSGSHPMTVIPVPVVAVVVSPDTLRLTIGGQGALSASARDDSSHVLTGRPVTWSSADTTVARVDGAGHVTAVAAGTTHVSATVEGVRGEAAVIVTPPPVASVTMSADQVGLVGSQTRTLSALMKDAAGHTLVGRAATWTSTNPAIVAVSAAGELHAVAPGAAQVIVTSENVSDTALVVAAVVTPRAIAAGRSFTCALDAAGAARCAGENRAGMVGNGASGTDIPVPTPTTVVGGHAFVFLSASRVSPAGDGGACGLTESGEAWCWGSSITVGQATNGTPVLISSPERFVRLSVGGSEVCGLTALGQAYCWGGGSYIMGNGPAAPLPGAAAALAAGGMTFTRLAVGYGFGCGIATAGGAYCWGVNNWGQLGTTAPNETCYGFACRTTPTPVSGGGALVDVSAGGEYACGLDGAGAAWCWGHNNYGQLGVGTPPNQNDAHTTPVAVSGGMSFRTVEAGQSGTCAITASDVAYCWGENLAAGTYNATPAAVAGLPAVRSLTMGSAHACGATAAGAFWCWGNNLWGQLGNGQTSQYYVPPFQTAWPPLASP